MPTFIYNYFNSTSSALLLYVTKNLTSSHIHDIIDKIDYNCEERRGHIDHGNVWKFFSH